jgi:hypothetical protein
MTVKLYLYNEDAVSERQWFPHRTRLPDYWCNREYFNISNDVGRVKGLGVSF